MSSRTARLSLAAGSAVLEVRGPFLHEGRDAFAKIVRPPVRRPPPALGQHSLEILRELGYSEDKVQEMAASGAVRPPPKRP